jgi:hypothetical protein
MALNHESGELIGDLGPGYKVVPVRKWMATTFFETAASAAAKAFCGSGSVMPAKGMRFDQQQILVQEYPQQNKLAFVFHRKVANRDHFYPYIFEFSPDMVAELVTAGHWDRSDN